MSFRADLLPVLFPILIGLITATIIAAIKKYQMTVREFLYRWARKLLPRVVTRWLRRRFVSSIGIERGNVPLGTKLQILHQRRRVRYFLLGAIYLDFSLAPVTITQLDGGEHSDLYPVELECGGSARYVGKYLHEEFGKRSHLFTRLGKGDLLSKELRRQLRDEEWIRRRHLSFAEGTQSGLSFHLGRNETCAQTTFTSKGALAGFEWRRTLQRLRNVSATGGILHISGYFRTGLSDQLVRSLKSLSPDLVVCLDHGRFQATDDVNATTILLGAFRDRLIDIYICTDSELDTLMDGARVDRSGLTATKKLERCAKNKMLPEMTVVRHQGDGEYAAAHLVVGTKVHPIRLREPIPGTYHMPGRNSSFNAGLVYHLRPDGPRRPDLPHDADLDAFLVDATTAALRTWARNT